MLSGILIASIHKGRLNMFRKVNAIRIRPRMQARSFRFMFMAMASGVVCWISWLRMFRAS